MDRRRIQPAPCVARIARSGTWLGRAVTVASSFLFAAPLAAEAGPYDGVYRQRVNAECALVGVDGGSLRIAGGIFYGVEMQCVMSRPVDVLDMDATLYTMQCSGESETWTERAMLMKAAEGNGIIMVWNGYAFRYDRCPAPAG